MSAIAIIEGLIKAGAAVKSAWTSARQRDPELDRTAFLGSSEFNGAYTQIAGILNGLTQPAVNKALAEIRGKQAALLGGKSVMELSTEKLAQYDALLDVENHLMHKYATNASKSAAWVSWLVDDALPSLIKVAKVVLPLLL